MRDVVELGNSSEFLFELPPDFWAAVRKKVEDINLSGGNLDLSEDMHPHRRTFYLEGDGSSVQEVQRFVRKITAH